MEGKFGKWMDDRDTGEEGERGRGGEGGRERLSFLRTKRHRYVIHHRILVMDAPGALRLTD